MSFERSPQSFHVPDMPARIERAAARVVVRHVPEAAALEILQMLGLAPSPHSRTLPDPAPVPSTPPRRCTK